MKNIFSHGDVASYGVVHGTILGIFNRDEALFISEYQRAGFKTLKQLYNDLGFPRNNVCMMWVIEHFGESDIPNILNQHRFAILSLTDLKKDINSGRLSYKDLLKKRHLQIKMAKFYLYRDADAFHRSCERAESIQIEIDALERRAKTHLTLDT